MFQIIRQVDPLRGCIPACARSALNAAGQPMPAENDLILAMQRARGLGFDQLAHAFGVLGLTHKVVIETPDVTRLHSRITELNAQGIPVLFPLGLSTTQAHCVVAAGCTAAQATFHDPYSGYACFGGWEFAQRVWTKDIAYINVVP
jgi:hypothetical protein